MEFQTPEDVEAFLDAAGVRFFKLALVDVDGVLRGKMVSREKLRSSLRKGLGFCDVVMGWDIGDQLYPGGETSSAATGFRDGRVRLDFSTLRLLPEEPETAFILGQYEAPYSAVCPRQVLERVVRRCAERGFVAEAAFEYEFFVFRETPESVRQKNYRNLEPWTPGMCGYSVLRSSVQANVYREFWDAMELLRTPLEGLHTETGPGVVEAALAHTGAREAADRAVLFKTFAKAFFQRRGLMATFMAKWNAALPGQSGHLHISLTDRDGRNVFYDSERGQPSALCEHFIAGQVLRLPELLAMTSPTVNSYKRMVPGAWAPTRANWGIENRTTAVRLIPDGEHGTRAEYRIGAADANPYLVLAAALASGLDGIERGMRVVPAEGDGTENGHALPRDLRDATDALESSEFARDQFGAEFVQHFAVSRRAEVSAFERHVTDFELARYFELI